jgi:hypothetical protein
MKAISEKYRNAVMAKIISENGGNIEAWQLKKMSKRKLINGV